MLCCGYTLTDFPISIRLISLALWQSNDCPSASKATLMNVDKYFMWIHYERLHNHNKQSTTKPCAYFLGYTVHPRITSLPHYYISYNFIYLSQVWPGPEVYPVLSVGAKTLHVHVHPVRTDGYMNTKNQGYVLTHARRNTHRNCLWNMCQVNQSIFPMWIGGCCFSNWSCIPT